MTFKYIRANRLSKNNKKMCACGDQNIKRQQEKQQQNNHKFECLYPMFANHHICVVLRSSAHYIGGQNCPILMNKSKYT